MSPLAAPDFLALDPARFDGAVNGQDVRLLTLRATDGFQVAVCNWDA